MLAGQPAVTRIFRATSSVRPQPASRVLENAPSRIWLEKAPASHLAHCTWISTRLYLCISTKLLLPGIYERGASKMNGLTKGVR